MLVRTRDRLVTSLKNEIELVAESWEVKYDKLLSLFDKLQKKYDELSEPQISCKKRPEMLGFHLKSALR